MFTLIKFVFKIFNLLCVACNMSLTYNLNFNKINVSKMVSYMKHFNEEYFFHQTSELAIVESVHNMEAKYYFQELLSEYVKSLSDIKYKLESFQKDYENDYEYYNVILVDSYDSFRKIDPGPKTFKQDFSEYYLIIFYATSKNPENEIQKIFNYCWYYYIVNVALLLQTKDKSAILLYTYYPFTLKFCHKVQLHIINYKRSVLDLKSTELFPDKFRNFYNCKLMAALWNVPPYLMLPNSGSAIHEMQGIEGYLLQVLAQVLQFNIDYIIPPNNEQRGLVKKDGTLTGAVKMLNERQADLSLGCFRCTLERSTLLSPSKTFYQTTQVFAVLALRESWNSFEIIAYPFHFSIWLVLLVLMLILLISTYMLEYLCKNVLKFIYGFSSAYIINLNIIAIVLGQVLNLMPQRNFARYLFLMWIVLTMILRTIYQGSLFDFLKSQKKLALPDTTNELTERKYQLIVNVATGDSLSNVPIIRDHRIELLIMNITDAGGFPILEANPDKRYVTGTPKDFLTYYVNTQDKYGVFHILKETIFSQQLCVYFTKHSYLVAPIDRVLENLRGFGLIDYWAEQLLDECFLEELEEASTETPLTFTQLKGIFQICVYLYILTIFVFFGEILWFKYLKNKCTRS